MGIKNLFRKKTKCRFRKELKKFVKEHSLITKKSPRVLFWEMGGHDLILRRNAMFATLLKVRGYKTPFIICDGISKACIVREITKNISYENWGDSCKDCIKGMKKEAERYGINYCMSSELIDKKEQKRLFEISRTIKLEDIRNYKYLGVAVGESALASFMRYLQGVNFKINKLDKENELIYREFFYMSTLKTHIADKALKKYKPVSFFTSHGIYADYAPAMFLAKQNNINSTHWNTAYKDFCFYIGTPKYENAVLIKGISNNAWEERVKMPFTDTQAKRVEKFFKERYFENKSSDIKFYTTEEDINEVKKKLGIDNGKPTVCFLPHINWDAVIDFPLLLFENSDEWILQTIDKILDIKDVNWLIKIHPAESIYNLIYGIKDLIIEKYKSLPEHIKIIDSDCKINTYSLYKAVDAISTIIGTAGAEIGYFGKPVICTGEVYFANKGFSIDSKTKEEYFSALENCSSLKPLPESQTELAKKFAHSYFFERQIPINIINKEQGHWGDIDLNMLEKLLPGKHPVLDKICDCIIEGKDVILSEDDLIFLENEESINAGA